MCNAIGPYFFHWPLNFETYKPIGLQQILRMSSPVTWRKFRPDIVRLLWYMPYYMVTMPSMNTIQLLLCDREIPQKYTNVMRR